MNEAVNRATTLYRSRFGDLDEVLPLARSGSGRSYFRIRGKKATVVATVGTDRAENEDFLALQGALYADGVRVPLIYAVSNDRMTYLQQDLGDMSLFSFLENEDKSSTCCKKLIEKALRELAHLQTGSRIVGTAALVRPPFDRRMILWDLNYFKYCFLKPLDVPMDENNLEDDFLKMASRLTGCRQELWGFMYRDCQSRNIMLYNEALYWIDFQGGRPGPLAYDVVSMLWQARLGLDDDVRKDFIKVYAEEMALLRNVTEKDVSDAVYEIVPLRVLQTLGAYGMRGITQRKEHFLKSIPAALASMMSLNSDGVLDAYPEIKKLTEYLWNKKQNITTF